jgi:hypothetical protein
MLPGITGLAGFGALKATTLAFQASVVQTANASTYTFASQPFGTASSGRVVVVAISAADGDVGTISSVTIGGVSASIIVQQSSSEVTCGIAAAVVPTGSTGTVVVNTSTSRAECIIGIWASTGLPGAVATDTDSNTDLSALTLTVDPGGFVIAVCANNGDRSTTWAGATEDYDVTGNAIRSSGASEIAGAGSVIVQPTLSGAASNGVFVAATF